MLDRHGFCKVSGKEDVYDCTEEQLMLVLTGVNGYKLDNFKAMHYIICNEEPVFFSAATILALRNKFREFLHKYEELKLERKNFINMKMVILRLLKLCNIEVEPDIRPLKSREIINEVFRLLNW